MSQGKEYVQNMRWEISPIIRGGGGHSRIGYIDALKGFSILCVVLGHIADGYLAAATIPEAQGLFYSLYNFIYAFHMPLFMMISGFTFCFAYFNESGNPETKRINKQIHNLILVFCLFSIFQWIFKTVVAGIDQSAVNRDTSFKDLAFFWIKPMDPYWYLYVLVIFYVLFRNGKLANSNKWIMIAVTGIVSVFSNVVEIGLFRLNNVLYYALFFLIGLYHQKYKNWIIGNKAVTLIGFSVSVILCFAFWNNDIDKSHMLNSIFLIRNVIAFGLSIGIWYLFENITFLANSKLFQLCGKYSLEIYVLHCFFTAGFRKVLPGLGICNAYANIVINMTLSTAIPIVFAVLCKRIGLHGLFFKPATFMTNLLKKREKMQ